ncbi:MULTISPECIES: ABC transporter substrate-binding protein [unclassified Synechocystis]|uniref:ABC transporter substrate-binding protein n=1 Tax=unclassified Synechocystis TaxID=2640012 RepID=UPI0004186C59|nr:MULTISPECIES: ABC transporter substrate-binding protein [unclassified Synechocystis]AIE74995.1 hypothetical protein D082_24670 [Synechocystis sp. PCC 6714]MCT0253297.1 ABC transporter substrate-binding protein [Synechocystis sp. CS-94]
MNLFRKYLLILGLAGPFCHGLGENVAYADNVPPLSPTTCQAANFPPPSTAAIRELAPTGAIRFAINTGNYVLATEADDFGPFGISVDIAHLLAKELGVASEFTVVQAAAVSFERVSKNLSDIGFFGIDPWRAKSVDYTSPYVQIEGAYIVRENSLIQTLSDVDRPGIEIVVGKNSVYNLFLDRNIHNAHLVQAPTSPEVTGFMLAHNFPVGAGIRNQLEADMKRYGGLRILSTPFMIIHQAMATGKDRPQGLSYLQSFVSELKKSGCVQELIKKYAVDDAVVPE